VKRGWIIAAALAVAAAGPLVAQSSPLIAAARASGQVGERFDGYLGFVTAPGPGVRQQVNSINIRRRSLYSDLARRRGVSPVEVAITAGCDLIGSVGVGEAYMLGDNVWRRRGPGQSAAVPQYCRP
jgi:uncharacterized protein YdbL (DUF1318 family)